MLAAKIAASLSLGWLAALARHCCFGLIETGVSIRTSPVSAISLSSLKDFSTIINITIATAAPVGV